MRGVAGLVPHVLQDNEGRYYCIKCASISLQRAGFRTRYDVHCHGVGGKLCVGAVERLSGGRVIKQSVRGNLCDRKTGILKVQRGTRTALARQEVWTQDQQQR